LAALPALMTWPGRTPDSRTHALLGGIHAGFQMTSPARRSPMTMGKSFCPTPTK
jgi:hypothetical protein